MNKITLKNIAKDELQFLIKNASFAYSNMTEAELKEAAESEDKILAKTVARQIQPKLEEMQHADPFKKAFLILKYLVLGNRNAKCTIPQEALASYVRTILPDIYMPFSNPKKVIANMKNGLKRKKRKRIISNN